MNSCGLVGLYLTDLVKGRERGELSKEVEDSLAAINFIELAKLRVNQYQRIQKLTPLLQRRISQKCTSFFERFCKIFKAQADLFPNSSCAKSFEVKDWFSTSDFLSKVGFKIEKTP